MATVNPFDLLGTDDTDDPSKLIAAAQQLKVQSQTKKSQTTAATQPAAKLPTKPLPPAQAVKEAKEGGRGGNRGGGGGGRGFGRGGRGGGAGFNRDSTNSENAFGNRDFSGGRGPVDESDASRSGERRGGNGGSRGSFRGGRRGGFGDGEGGDVEQPRRVFERRSGTGRGYEMKREGAGRGNWGTPTDELSQVVEEVANEVEKIPSDEKLDTVEADTSEGNKDTPANETEEKEPEAKEMTLEEYEKVLEEKRKALQSLKTEERKVDDKAFASMQPLANKKKNSDDIFIKLGSDKDKKKELAEKEEKAKKALSINEFLKPPEGERYYSPSGGRGRGGRGGRGSGSGSGRGYNGGNSTSNVEAAPSIGDPGQFPTLGAK